MVEGITGRYLVTTENSRYLIDFDKGVSVRENVWGKPMQGDGTELTTKVIHLVKGQPMKLAVFGFSDDSDAGKLITTSDVIKIEEM